MKTEDHLSTFVSKGAPRHTEISTLISARNVTLLSHRYFHLCRHLAIGREQTLEIVKQLYCFSVFFERLLTRRISDYSSDSDPRVVAIARKHLREEIGHAEMFQECLRLNGISEEEMEQLAPKLFTKALFGYLHATIQHENEYVANVAIIQVMESIGYHFFSHTLKVMEAHGLCASALVKHAEDDENHPELGMDLVAEFDGKTLADCRRIIEDIYRLMGFVLDEWLGARPESASARWRPETAAAAE